MKSAETVDESKPGVTVLDCTLRDGGYYCNWDFDDRMVARYLSAIAQAGIGYVEVGFRSRTNSGFAGKYKFSSDAMITRLCGHLNLGVAVMIDAKDFLQQTAVDHQGLRALFRRRVDSPVELVRVATTAQGLPQVAEICSVLKDLGYDVAINLMQANLFTEAQLEQVVTTSVPSTVDVLYLADSFGGLTPEHTHRLIRTLKTHFPKKAGFHSHDNLGLALANSLAAISAGADLVDASLLGMGRGAGNLRTEQLLLYLRFKNGAHHLDPSPLFDVVSTDFAALQARYQWGVSLPYMLSAVYDVHPSYAQQLLQVGYYTPLEVARILEVLRDRGNSTSFNTEQLSDALRERFTTVHDQVAVSALPNFRSVLPSFEGKGSRPVLLLGAGPSVHQRAEDINEFIRAQQPVVIECNLQHAIITAPDHLSLFTNVRRLEEHVEVLATKRQRVVLGMPSVSRQIGDRLEGMEVYHYAYQIHDRRFEVETASCVIPHDVVAQFAFALALRLGAPCLYLCGFDGYRDHPSRDGLASQLPDKVARELEREMEEFIRMFKQHEQVRAKAIRVVSLTPTSYDVDAASLYAYF